MGFFDGLFDAAGQLVDLVDKIFSAVLEPDIGEQDVIPIVASLFEDLTPLDEFGSAAVEFVEAAILADVREKGEINPDNVEDLANSIEGSALAALGTFGAAGTALEAASLGQLESHQEFIVQGLSGLAIDDVTGMELDARIQEGIMPALEARAGKQHRAKFVELPDAVEYLLRNKTGDSGWLSGDNIPSEAYKNVRSRKPVNPDNALEEWGIRDDQLEILEEVSLEAMEFEELIETPAELGIVVDDDVLDLVLDLAGYPEELKDFLRQVPEEIPRTTRVYEERTTLEELVSELDTLVRKGERSPAAAGALLPDEADVAQEALIDRWQLLEDLPLGTPTRSQLEDSFSRGFLSYEELEEILNRSEFNTQEYEGVLKSAVIDELDGSLQESVALGLISEAEFSDIAAEVGIDDATVELLLQGQSFTDISKQRLQQSTAPDKRLVGTIVGIGESRARALTAVGIETVADLAQADAETVAETAQVSQETAAEFINRARQRVN